MPYLSDRNEEEAVKNAKILIQSGANAVKLEGNKEEQIKAVIKENIPVMGHLGLLPQTAKTFKMQGKEQEAADQLIKDAKMSTIGFTMDVLVDSGTDAQRNIRAAGLYYIRAQRSREQATSFQCSNNLLPCIMFQNIP